MLRRIGLAYEVVLPQVDETCDLPAEEAVAALSRRKAEDAAARRPGAVVIAADTLVVCGGSVLGKPNDEEDAFRMLRSLSGTAHTVFTGVTAMRGGDAITRVDSAAVRIRSLTGAQIRAYIATGEPMDKAGAYGIQERGAALVERVEGDFYTVMGLPVCLLAQMLERFGIDILL